MESFLGQLPLNYRTLPCTQIFYFQFNGDDYEKGIAARRVHRKVILLSIKVLKLQTRVITTW